MLKKFAIDITHGLRSMVRGFDADWDFSERRKTQRIPCRHKVEFFRGEYKKIAYVLDYSMGGVRLTCPDALKVGEKLKIQFPHPLPGVSVRALECEVLWVRKNTKTLERLAGLKFVESGKRLASSWVAYFLRERESSAADIKERRRMFRAECKLEGLARDGVDTAMGQVQNLSLTGAMVQLNRPAEVDDEWTLDLSGLSSFKPIHLKYTVLSCDAGDAGLYKQRIEFDEPDEETMKQLKKYMAALSKDFWTD